jgi:hypothetical protein
MMFSGTDYGIKTQSTTVRMTASRVQAHLELFNRFQVLGLSHANVEDAEYERQVRLASPRVEKPYRVTSGVISQSILTRSLTRKRERRKVQCQTKLRSMHELIHREHLQAENGEVANAEHELSIHPFSKLRDAHTVLANHQVHRLFLTC